MLIAKKFKAKLRTNVRYLKADPAVKEEVLIWLDRQWLEFMEKMMIHADSKDVKPSKVGRPKSEQTTPFGGIEK